VSPSSPPELNCNFLVDLGSGDPHHPSAGFCEVIFPEFHIDKSGEHRNPQNGSPANEKRTLVLRRGATKSLELYRWWDSERCGNAHQPRTVRVHLLAADHATPVLSWTFFKAHPVTLGYSSLNALDGSVLFESIELEFDSMQMG
jgi:phage tail-like protein